MTDLTDAQKSLIDQRIFQALTIYREIRNQDDLSRVEASLKLLNNLAATPWPEVVIDDHPDTPPPKED